MKTWVETRADFEVKNVKNPFFEIIKMKSVLGVCIKKIYI